ncbi:MAG: SRPBCC domain-containing protein [Nevskia sp.]|nr:SRPBCC domain-containing protein [Nevskia sp.]
MANKPDAQPRSFTLRRTFSATPEQVFRAWSSAGHLRHWFCPDAFSVAEAEVEFRVGGVFNICMRTADGEDHWTNGRFLEIQPHSRLVIEMEPRVAGGQPLFRAHTAVGFEATPQGTVMTLEQRYTPLDPAAASMIEGAPRGWAQTLERLAQEVKRIKGLAPFVRSAVHATFRIERIYPATRTQVYRALTDPEAKSKWFTGGSGYTVLLREMEVRPGGRETLKGRWENGLETTFAAVYYDVVPEERLVYAYDMYMDERKLSVSLATFEIQDADGGTRLVLTEQGAFLDGYDDAGAREHGSGLLLDALGASLRAAAMN